MRDFIHQDLGVREVTALVMMKPLQSIIKYSKYSRFPSHETERSVTWTSVDFGLHTKIKKIAKKKKM